MMDGATMRALQSEAAAQAAADAREPLLIWLEHVEDDILRIPNLGDYCPDSWTLCDMDDYAHLFEEVPYSWKLEGNAQLFVDSSGMGSEGEAALTMEEYADVVRRLVLAFEEEGHNLGLALFECGQFQVHVGVYSDDDRRAPLVAADVFRLGPHA